MTGFRRRRLLVVAIALTAVTNATGCGAGPTEPRDEQAVKRDSQRLLEEIHQGWAQFSPGWSQPDTLVYRTGSDPCRIVTTANLGAGWGDGSRAERLAAPLDQVLRRHGFAVTGGSAYENGQAVLASAHQDGRTVEFRGRSGDLEATVPAPASRCEVAPRRI